MIETLSIPASTHGRVLVKRRRVSFSEKRHPTSFSAATLVGFHGYAQGAEDMMDALAAIPAGDAPTLISIQALNRFYTRGDQKIVASWMTRQDREETIADNVGYVDRVLETISGVVSGETTPDIVFLGFSQGVAMAYRAALLGKRPAAGIIAIGGDVPPDVKTVPAEKWPRVMIAAGAKDDWYTAEKIAADEAFLKSHGVTYEIYHHDAGHEITAGVREAAARFLASSPV